MDIEEATTKVKKVISEVLERSIEKSDDQNDVPEIVPDMNLIGGNSPLDSMKLVEVCLELEDIADDLGFEFDWTSESALSKSRSMFRTLQSLSQEFLNQSKEINS